MFPLSGFPARIAYSVLAAVVAYIIVYILGVLLLPVSADIGALLKQFAPLIAILIGIVTFFSGWYHRPPAA